MLKKFNIHFSFSVKTKSVALTFDDGPHPYYTPEVLKILAENQAKATFFVSGHKIDKYKKIIAEALKNGHQVANHSFNHRNFIFRSYSSMQKDLAETDEKLRECGIKGNIPFRPPYGRFDLMTIFLMKRMRKQMILWNASTKDFKANSKEEVLTRLNRKFKPGCIIVMHDAGKYINSKINRNPTLEALREFLPQKISEGFSFLTINEMLNL